MAQYEQIRYADEKGARHTVILRDPRDIEFFGAPAVTGIQVNREGDEIATQGADERLCIIGADLIVRRTEMVWNLKYAILEGKGKV